MFCIIILININMFATVKSLATFCKFESFNVSAYFITVVTLLFHEHAVFQFVTLSMKPIKKKLYVLLFFLNILQKTGQIYF